MRSRLIACVAFTALCSAQPALNSYQEGLRLLRHQNWQAAAAALEQAVASEPKNLDAQIALGIARLRSGNVQAGLSSFRRAVALNAASVDAHYNLGLALREAGQAPAALTEFATTVRLAPNHDEARLALALAYQQSGKVDQAIAQCEAVLKRNPQSAEAHNWLGVFRMQKSQVIDAVAQFRKAVEAKPEFVRAWNNLGSALAQGGDMEASVAAFKKAVALDPSDSELRMNLGIALRGKGDADAALQEFQSVLKTSPSNIAVRHQLALTLKQQGNLAAAIDGFEAVLNLDPEHREAYYNLASVLRQQAAVIRRGHPAARTEPAVEARLREAQAALSRGERTAARSILERASQEGKSSAEIFNLLGFVQGQEPDLNAALVSLKRAVELDPAMPAARYNLGVALWLSGARDAAVDAFEQSLRLDPAAPEVYAFLGMARRERKESERARTALQRAIALGPNLPAPYVDLGLLFLDAGQWEKGIGQIEAALNLPAPAGPIPDLDQVIAELQRVRAASPDTAGIHNVLGLLLGKRGAEPAQVIAEFREAVRLRPDYSEARNNLGLVLVQAGDNEAAITEFRQALAVAPEYTAALANLGAALVPSRPAEAVALLEKAVALQPSYVRAQYNLALAYAQDTASGAAKAAAQFQKVVELQPDFAAAHFEYGKLLFQKNSLPEAITQFREAVKLDPKFGAARYQLGLALTRAGQRSEGASELEKARPAIEAERKLEIAGQLLGEARAAMESGQNQKAVDTLRTLLRELPTSVDAHYQLGLALLASGDRNGATAAFQKALELDPQYAPARQSLQPLLPASSALPDDAATVALFEDYVRKQRFKELEPLVADYLKTHPNSWWAHYVLGYAQFGQRRIGDSVASLAKSLELNVKNAEAHQLLGRDLMAIGRFDTAQTELEQAVKLKPQSAEIRYDLAKIHSANDNFPPAKRELEEAIRLDPAYIDAYDALGFVMEAMSDDEAAVALYKKAAEMDESRGGNFASPYVNLAAYYNRLGDPDLAQQYARKALQRNAKSDGGNFQLGKALERRGKLPEAAAALNRAIAINASTSSYHYVLSGVYRRLGKTQEAQEQMEIFRKLEKEAADFEQKRREVRQAARPKQ